jgi:putative hydrolase of the HAD superfamily
VSRLHQLPRGVLLDLDDTILDDTGTIEPCWRYACASQPDARIDPDTLYEAIERTRAWFWSDPERHRVGRLDLDAAARAIVAQSLTDIGADPLLAETISRTYRQRRIDILEPCVGAVETVRWLREQGCRLALVTNGASVTQRNKVSRYGLLELFDTILIEGELGFGKPDPRVYMRALKDLNVTAVDAWMIGDHLEFDVAQPQKMGLHGIWIDARGQGVPPGRDVRPHRILRRLSDLRW